MFSVNVAAGENHPASLAAGVAAIGLDALRDRGALCVLRHVPVIARVVEAVRHHVPLPRFACASRICRIVIEHREIERGSCSGCRS